MIFGNGEKTMTEPEILNLLKEAFAFAATEEAEAAENLTLEGTLDQFGVSSIVAFEMAGYIEDKLDIQFADDELAQISTIKGFVNLIRQYTETKFLL
jgi:acyl carrier protein